MARWAATRCSKVSARDPGDAGTATETTARSNGKTSMDASAARRRPDAGAASTYSYSVNVTPPGFHINEALTRRHCAGPPSGQGDKPRQEGARAGDVESL